jgi:plastocyanin
MRNRIAVASLLVVLALGLSLLTLSCKKSNPAGPGAVADVTIGINGNLGASSYSPATATITVGQTVSWRNNDSMTHTSIGDGVPLWNTQNIAPGATSTPIQINTAGTHGYHCAIHPNTMTGTLQVNP